MTERKYALTRVKAGDYLLLSNDGKTVWRIATYAEGGSARKLDNNNREVPITGTFWGLWKYTGRSLHNINTEEWSDFDMFEGMLLSRREAVNAAMKQAVRS